jgi:hypothetical protein
MITGDQKGMIKETLTLLQNADGEMNRPRKDVVSMSVCNASRESMKAMMHVYLLTKGKNVNVKNSVQEMMNQCVLEDSDFSGISLAGIGCRELDHAGCEGRYCLDHENVDACLKIANSIKDLVIRKMSINPKDLS